MIKQLSLWGSMINSWLSTVTMPENPYTEQFASLQDFPICEETKSNFIICSTPRCGSHLLGHLLHQTGVMGFPLEYFNPPEFDLWKKRFGTHGIIDTLKEIKRHRTSLNGYFGCKLHYSHYEFLVKDYDFYELFPDAKFIHLKRRDILAQAISYVKAVTSGQWISATPQVKEPVFSTRYINNAMQKVARWNACWDCVFSRRDLPYITIYYEDLIEDSGMIVNRISSFLDIEFDRVNSLKVFIPHRQYDKVNDEWRQRYLEDVKKSGWHDDSRILSVSTAERMNTALKESIISSLVSIRKAWFRMS